MAVRYQVPVTLSQPSRGPNDALVTIVEWCDFASPACRKVDATLDAALARFPRDVRVVFRHFAEVSDVGQLPHELAQAAFEQLGRFWEAKRLLASAQRIASIDELEPHAKQLGMSWTAARDALERHTHAGHIASDRAFAAMFGVRDVPALFVNGRRLAGEPTRPALLALVEEELAHAKALVARGTPRTEVYRELTKDGTWERQARAAR